MIIDYSQLLIDVQKKATIVVSNISDIKFLKEEIESETGIIIGFNTLRRLFGFLDKTNPSVTTLNTLASYIGFSSYYKYRNHKFNYDVWYFQQKLNRIKLSNKISSNDIISINNSLLSEGNILYLAYFLSFQIQQNNIKILDFIFKHVNFNSISNTNFHKFSTILSTSLLSISEKKALIIYEKLIHFDVFRNNVPLLYIDYTNLNKRYGKILIIVEKYNFNPSDLFFVHLMKAYNNYYTDIGKQFLDIKKPKEFESLYIVLRGRFFGYCILRNEKLYFNLKKEILDNCKKGDVSLLLQEIVPALIIKEEYPFLEDLINMFYEDLFESDRWDANTSSAIYLIALANVNWKNNNIKTAKTNLELGKLENVELGYENYISLFYYLTKLKISFSEKNKLENIKVYLSIKEIVKFTGFKKFITESKKYLLK